MPAVSKAQQRFMGMVHAADKGEEPASPEVAKVAASMDDKSAKDFASTKHKGLPNKVREIIVREARGVKTIHTEYSKVLDAMETHLNQYKKTKGTPEEAKHIEALKKLTVLKKKLQSELDAKVSGLYKDAELKGEIDEMGSGDIHFKRVMEFYHNGTPSARKKVAIVVTGDKNASRLDIVRELHSMGYDEIQEVEEELGISIKEMTTSDAAGPYNTPYAFGKPENEKKKGKRQADLTGYSVVSESETPSDIVKDLDKVKNDLLKKVDVLIAKKKKLYSDVDIESPMSGDEKKLNKDIADLFSQINTLVLQKRDIVRKSVNESQSKKYKVIVTENRWIELKKEDSPATTKIGKGISNINKQLAEMEKFLNWYSRIKQENGISNENFWKRTNTNIYRIKERLIKLEQHIRKISQ